MNSHYNVKSFIEQVHDAKIQAERKMRLELDLKIIQNQRIKEQLEAVLGEERVSRLILYIKEFNNEITQAA